VYVAEGHSSDTATVIEWCRNIGLFDNYEEISDLVSSVKSSGEVYFVPSFSGIQAPVNDEAAATGFIGMRPSTRKEHLLRAAVESLAFRVYQLCQLMSKEIGQFGSMRVDGGVSRNDFLMQLIADLTHLDIERPTSIETAVHGAAYLAGLTVGVWNSREELQHLYKTDRVFKSVSMLLDFIKNLF
jgi:putative glycerol kinase 5